MPGKWLDELARVPAAVRVLAMGIMSYERTVKAAEKALASLDMKVIQKTASSEVTQIISKYADGRQVWIDVRPISDKNTKLEIRVGAAGDEAASATILEKIKRNL